MPGLLLLAALALAQPSPPCRPQFAPLETGTYSGASRIPFWSKAQAGDWGGSGWLGWSWQDTVLQPVRLMVRDRPNDDPDGDDEVTVESEPDVTFAVRCVPRLRAGRIETTTIVNESLDDRRRRLPVVLGTDRYELLLESAHAHLYDARIILTDGRRRQVLYSADGFADEPHFHVVWAGDLDNDGGLDLVVNLSRKYSMHPYRLLLSSMASGTDLVGDAAVFETGD